MKWLVKYFRDLDTILNMLSHATIAMVFRKHVVLDEDREVVDNNEASQNHFG